LNKKRRDTQLENDSNQRISYTIDDVIAYANEHHLENLIAIDNTASADFVTNYISLVENSFDLISSNSNTLSYSFIKNCEKFWQKTKRRIFMKPMLEQVCR
jgi:aspartokinase/homoserine dehydrogenase 1